MNFDTVINRSINHPKEIIKHVYNSLKEKGYKPIKQIIGYIMSGDPSYITAHNDARNIIQKLERDEILEEIMDFYIKNN
ncbi:MAG: IreB family regulatory phosphoprotein [Clostridiales bacterium]|jgi:uncharacterized protein (UPF0297 family)|nr:IreB family regulatory phosphoprotein [Clostridiales bacterium]